MYTNVYDYVNDYLQFFSHAGAALLQTPAFSSHCLKRQIISLLSITTPALSTTLFHLERK